MRQWSRTKSKSTLVGPLGERSQARQERREREGGYNYVGKLKRASSAMRQFVQHLNGRAEALTKVLKGEESAARGPHRQ